MRFKSIEDALAYRNAYEEFQTIKTDIDDAFSEGYEMYLVGLANLIGLKNAFSIFPIQYMGKFKMSNDPIDQELFASFMNLRNKINIQSKNVQNLRQGLDEIKSELDQAAALVMTDRTIKNVDILWEAFINASSKIDAKIEEFRNRTGIVNEIKKEL